MKKTTAYTTSSNTAGFLDAMRAYNDFLNVYLTALEGYYCEAADTIAEKNQGALNAVRELLEAHLLDSINDQLNATKSAGPYTI